MKPFHRATQLHDVCELAPNLRFEDKREVNTLGKTSEQSLLTGYLFGRVCRSIIITMVKLLVCMVLFLLIVKQDSSGC